MKVLRMKDLVVKVGLGQSTIYRMMGAGEFPKPFELVPGRSGWLEDVIDEWLAARAGKPPGAVAEPSPLAVSASPQQAVLGIDRCDAAERGYPIPLDELAAEATRWEAVDRRLCYLTHIEQTARKRGISVTRGSPVGDWLDAERRVCADLDPTKERLRILLAAAEGPDDGAAELTPTRSRKAAGGTHRVRADLA
ncbi:AlpA family phage regulatory protein [Burkholderia ambifaria]|uniref:AlpA family phage regulatory protein n=1 Tax=Burkholderia ambifaria TaxID=152480 RepID=UPI001E3C1684|nr:AlpA family phage regulatory protein [Burkholderia ambifaria]UEP21388.1 AlpA family phage regulatory protein [Burkholderia ambifaria]